MKEVMDRIENKLLLASTLFFSPMGYSIESLNIFKGVENDSYLIIEFTFTDEYTNKLVFNFITEYHNWKGFNCDIFIRETILNKIDIGVYLQKFMGNLVNDTELMRDLELYSILVYENKIC